jgi:hypothetical protein
MAQKTKIIIDLVGESVADGNQWITELQGIIENYLTEEGTSREAHLERFRRDGETQDFGATLIVLLGTPAAIAIAKGVHDFIAKRGSKVVIRTPEGTVVAQGDGAKNIDVAKTAEALRRRG